MRVMIIFSVITVLLAMAPTPIREGISQPLANTAIAAALASLLEGVLLYLDWLSRNARKNDR